MNNKNNKNKFTLIDQPGFGDTLGLYQILSNSCFHYLTFSQVKKAKFILVISFAELEGKLNGLKSVILAFLNFFKKYS